MPIPLLLKEERGKGFGTCDSLAREKRMKKEGGERVPIEV